MATKIKKEDFDKYSIKGFKIGDIIYIPEAGIQAEIMAVDLDEDCTYGVMIDATQINLKEEDFIDVPIKDCYSETVYYRKKALKNEYKIWVNIDKIEHVCVTHTREDSLEDKQEEYVNEEDVMEEDNDTGENSIEDADCFYIEDVLTTSLCETEVFDLKLKESSTELESSNWINSDMDLVEVNSEEATYIAFIFDNECIGKFIEFMYNNIDDKEVLEEIIPLTIDDIVKERNAEPILNSLYIESKIVSYNVGRTRSAALIKV